MKDIYEAFENLSLVADFGVTILDTCGQTVFESSVCSAVSECLQMLYASLEDEQSCRISLLYGCYQARRFGGRYIFLDPSGLAYCAAPLLDEKGRMTAGAIAGPFILTDHDDYLSCDILWRKNIAIHEIEALRRAVTSVPCKTPKQIQSISEHLYYVTAAFTSQIQMVESVSMQMDFFLPPYPIDKENELLSAISEGDVHTAEATLNDMIREMLFHCGGNIETLRSRAVELTTLLSRATIKGGADINAILGMNYSYLREIDTFSSLEDIVIWLQMITRNFMQQVFDFPGVKHINFIYKAVDYIKRNFAEKITLQDISSHLYISQSYLCRIFKEETGQTLVSYLTAVRIKESKKYLRDSSIHMIDIPQMVGFEGQSYFTRIFKKIEGCTPGKYRQKYLER